MILLDTEDVPVGERVEAFHAAFHEATVPTAIAHEGDGAGIRLRAELWDLGVATVFASTGTGFRLSRGRRHLRQEGPPIVALALQTLGAGRFGQGDHQDLVPAGRLMLVDLTRPYEFGWSEGGGSMALQVPYDRLGLPADTVRRAAGRLGASALYPLVHQHLTHLRALGDALDADPGTAALGNASVELMRALVVSAAGDGQQAGPVLESTLTTRLLSYLRGHAADPALTPQRIAQVHGISVRRLYALADGAGFSIEQALIDARLEKARAALASPAAHRRTIAAVAREAGFPSASHFARRFRAAYGMTPSEWRRAHRL